MPKVQAVGIDLGTTYSAFARIDETGRSTMLRNGHGELLTPSVVLFDDTEIVVGKEAKKLLGTQTDRVADCVKRDMGSPAYSRAIRGAKIPPEVIQSCILRSLKADAVAAVGENFKTVITVPAYFDESRRKSTVDAAEMAGIEVLDIVNEPTAAALAYGENLGYLDPGGAPKREMNILVYDLGGGTFDVTVLNLKVGVVSTLATDGDVRLGGRDWDERLANYVAEQFCRTHCIDPRSDAVSLARLLRAAEDAKHTLSARDQANVHVECQGRTGDVAVTRAIFEELTEDLLERTAYTMRQVITSAKLAWHDIAHVLLVGGSTRMPMVSAMIERVCGRPPEHSVNPDEAVARGAAIFAAYLIALRDDRSPGPKFKVSDVNAHSLGIECVDQQTLRRENVVLIPRNTVLPAKASEKFITKSANQQSIVVQVLEGESKTPQQCMPVARAVMRKLPANLPQGWPIEVTYEYGTNGRLSVRAQVPGTVQQLRLELERDHSLSNEKLNRWRQIITADAGFGSFEGMLENVLTKTGLAGDEGPKTAQRPVEPAFRGHPPVAHAATRPVTAPARPISLAAPAPAPGLAASSPASNTSAPAAEDDAYELEYVQPEVVSEAPARATIAERPLVVRSRKSSNRAVMIALVGHILAPLIGIALGYYILCLIVPEANALNLPLPGLQVTPEPPDRYRDVR